MFPFEYWKNHAHTIVLNMDIISKAAKGYSLMVPDQKEIRNSHFVGNVNIFPILSFLRNPQIPVPNQPFWPAVLDTMPKPSRKSVF